MFGYQRNFSEAVRPCTAELFYEVVKSDHVARTIERCRKKDMSNVNDGLCGMAAHRRFCQL